MGRAPRASNGDQASAQAIADAIKREAIGYVAKAVIATAVGIIGLAGLGLWIYVKHYLPELAGGVPRGAVLAFDRDDLTASRCPEGWEPFLEARARTIVGAGNPADAPGKMAADENNRSLRGYVLRQHGGQQLWAKMDEDNTLHVEPHTNMIPYIALYYCKKD